MIPVAPRPEPADFTETVRLPGLRRIAESGKADKAFWRKCHLQLYNLYGGFCAHLAVRIPRSPADGGVGGSSVDHFLPRDRFPRLAYEWRNWRLCSTNVNAFKGSHVGILDPFHIGDGWFRLNPVTGAIFPDPSLPPAIRKAVERTTNILHLNDPKFLRHRLALLECDVETLKLESPFLHAEALRLGLSLPAADALP